MKLINQLICCMINNPRLLNDDLNPIHISIIQSVCRIEEECDIM